jgi:hypothetical protein
MMGDFRQNIPGRFIIGNMDLFINLHRIAGNDLAPELLAKIKGYIGFAHRRGADNKNDFL